MMRSSRELELRGRLEVLKLGIVGGLLVLLMIVTVGCDDA